MNFCNEIFQECKTAEYGGKTIEEIYKNGENICEAQNFQVIKTNSQCFKYDPDVFSKSTTKNLAKMFYYLNIFFLINKFL